MKKKWISALVCMAMVLTLLPAAAFAEDGETVATSVTMGYSTSSRTMEFMFLQRVIFKEDHLPNTVLQTDLYLQKRQKFLRGYIEYNNGTIIVHGDVTFTSAGSSPIYVKSGTLTITGDEDASLTLKCTSGGSPVQISSANTSANLVLAGGVNFTATRESTVLAIGSYSKNNFETAENYSGDIYLSSKSRAINGGNVNLKTSGSISLSNNVN